MPFNVAEMLQYPLNTIIACPFESGALLMVAIAVSDEVQTTIVVKSCTELSEKEPVALNWSCIPELIPRVLFGVMLIVLSTAVLSLTPLTPVRPTLLLSGGAPPPPPQEVSVSVRLTSIYISDLINLQFHMLDSLLPRCASYDKRKKPSIPRVHPSTARPSWFFKTLRFPYPLTRGAVLSIASSLI